MHRFYFLSFPPLLLYSFPKIIRHIAPQKQVWYHMCIMIRACPRSLVIGLCFALLAMTFMIASLASCTTTVTNSIQGPFCAVERASSPISATHSAPDMALSQQLSFIFLGLALFACTARRILPNTHWNPLKRAGRVRDMRCVRGETTAFRVFIPQIASAHGM